jgi:aspartate kinase
MIVMKFGGTSVGTAERIRGLAERVRERRAEKPVVVVSALSKVTDLLVNGAQSALARDPGHETVADAFVQRHLSVLSELFPAGGVQDELRETVQGIASELHSYLVAVASLGELTPRTLDAVSGMGERASFEIVAAALRQAGLEAQGIDSRDIVVTDESFGRAAPIMEETEKKARAAVVPLVERGIVPVLPGFVGRTRKGVATTLGRGGGDWSAAIIGGVLQVREIQIWTDVDGLMTVDPRLVPSAHVIAEVSYEEAAELAYFGAKVLHPATIRPAVDRGIPVRILNSHNPSAPGTLITRAGGLDGRPVEGTHGEPRAIAFKKGISVVLISQPRMLMAYGFVAKVFEVFAAHKTPVDLIATSEVSISLTVDDTTRLPAVAEEMAPLGDVQVIPGQTIVSVVGRGFVARRGLAGTIFQTLRDVNVVMISFGASDVNLSFVVADQDAETAVRLLHREFFEGHRG